MPKSYTKEELENGRWVTMKGTRVFIKDGETPQEAIDRSLGKSVKKEVDPERQEYLNNIRTKLLNSGVDEKHTEQIINAINKIHDKFPEVREPYGITVTNTSASEVASMNGIGLLNINRDKLQKLQNGEYDYLFNNYLAGNNFENGLIGHELAHNLDMQFGSYVMSKAPNGNKEEVMNARNEKWANVLSEATGRKVNVGEDVKFPTCDSETGFLTVGDKTYSIKTMPEHLSDIVVPQAISNIQNNYRKYGFETEPSRAALAKELSGYARHMEESSDFYVEVFAESYAGSISGHNSALGSEVTKLTEQVYSDLSKRKSNEYHNFMNKFNEAVKKAQGGK